jgi:hypothetical protein
MHLKQGKLIWCAVVAAGSKSQSLHRQSVVSSWALGDSATASRGEPVNDEEMRGGARPLIMRRGISPAVASQASSDDAADVESRERASNGIIQLS